jgi:hypothetical protein
MKFEWKFYAMLFVALVGVAVPIWLWQADIDGKSLAVRLISNVELQVAQQNSIPDLQVTVGGIVIESPILSTVEIANDGSRPVPTNDYEGPITIEISKNSKIIRANILSVSPSGLPVRIETTNESIKIYPLLLNPGDKMVISIISSGELPALITQARIAGVSKIKYSDETKTDKKSVAITLLELTKFLISLSLYFIFSIILIRRNTIYLSKKLIILSITCFALLAISSSRYVYNSIGVEAGLASIWPTTIITIIVAGIVSYYNSFKPIKNVR